MHQSPDDTAVSIHAPHAGRDCTIVHDQPAGSSFNPRALCGARPSRRSSSRRSSSFNPRAPCGARLHACRCKCCAGSFNPRTPCGARRLSLLLHGLGRCFNPRAPCGARPSSLSTSRFMARFQSTRPVRGATCFQHLRRGVLDVSIHAPHAGRDVIFPSFFSAIAVSIHAPRAGRDCCPLPSAPLCGCFNPRAPCGARPAQVRRIEYDKTVSIHAPRAGRDTVWAIFPLSGWGFNPRAPCGARLSTCGASRSSARFNPRAPCGARR